MCGVGPLARLGGTWANCAFGRHLGHLTGLAGFTHPFGREGPQTENKTTRGHMINRKLTAEIPLTTDGGPWVGYTFNNFSSGKLPMPNHTQWSHSVERHARTIFTFVGDNEVQEKPVREIGGVGC